jgi:hypothetical protein
MNDRRAKIVALRKKNPCFTLQKIADITDCSRENVRQILDKEKLSTKGASYGSKGIHICPSCGKSFRVSNTRQIHCSHKCWHKSHSVTIECLQCGKKFEKRFSDLIIYPSHKRRGYQHNCEFCSHSCAMKHYWKNKRMGSTQ